MTKHAKKSDHLQLVDAPKTTIVEIPLPLLGALGVSGQISTPCLWGSIG